MKQDGSQVISKLTTSNSLGRKRASLRLLRAREACGLTQEEVAKAIGVTERAYGAIERAEVRMVALEALMFLEGSLEEGKAA